jgi:hypothetical protein
VRAEGFSGRGGIVARDDAQLEIAQDVKPDWCAECDTAIPEGTRLCRPCAAVELDSERAKRADESVRVADLGDRFGVAA